MDDSKTLLLILDELVAIKETLQASNRPASRETPSGGRPHNPKINAEKVGDVWRVNGAIPDDARWIECPRCGGSMAWLESINTGRAFPYNKDGTQHSFECSTPAAIANDDFSTPMNEGGQSEVPF
jgi:hypothetical protein